MSDKKSVRLNKLVKEFNVSIDRIYSFLRSKGIEDLKPNTKVSNETYMELLGEFDSEKKAKLSANLLAKEKELEKAEEIIKQQEKEIENVPNELNHKKKEVKENKQIIEKKPISESSISNKNDKDPFEVISCNSS